MVVVIIKLEKFYKISQSNSLHENEILGHHYFRKYVRGRSFEKERYNFPLKHIVIVRL